MTDDQSRVALAMSIAGHRATCPQCKPILDQIVLALQGATIDEIRELAASSNERKAS